MMTKPFSKKLYKDDDNAKLQVIDWLKRNGYDAWVNPDDYDIDVLADKNGVRHFFEVEVKHNWNGIEFPFDTVHFSARKRKYVKPNAYFTMLNHQRNRILVVDYETLSRALVVKKDTVYTSDERFIEVQVKNCAIFKINK